MQTGGGHLAAGKQTGYIGRSGQIGLDAADHIVRTGTNGDHVFGDINSKTFTQYADQRKPPLEVNFVKMPNIQIHMRGAGFQHPVQDRPADHIARRQFAGRVVFFHERFVVAVPQHAALAAKCLGHQCARGPGDIQRRRVKLHHFHIPQHRPGPPGHR